MDHGRKMYHMRDMENRVYVKVNMNGKTLVSSKPQESLACLKIRWGSKRMKLDGVQRKINDTENGSRSGAGFWGQNVVSGNEAARGVKKMENEPEAYQVCCSAISVSIPSILQAFGATAYNLLHVRFMAEMMYVDVKNVIIWGNHSSTQYPDVTHATVGDKPVLELIKDDEWVGGYDGKNYFRALILSMGWLELKMMMESLIERFYGTLNVASLQGLPQRNTLLKK
ncbi:malate dehydrogenase [Tanacetum coccineum]